MLLTTVTEGKVTASPHPLLFQLQLSLQMHSVANDNQHCRNVKEMLTMSLNFKPISETLPSWKVAAYESNTPEFATITYNITDNEWELRNKFGELVETHRHKDELIVELEIWKQIWNASQYKKIPGNSGNAA